ncbi:MAG: hypothetical protein JO163_03475 [Methylobacteriaceae bacterium]|nr:hypothetical protein [Methylobacteriaceae bacterium]
MIALIPINAQAFPVPPAQPGYAIPGLTLVEGGCGPGWHRNAWGACRPNGPYGPGPYGPGPGPYGPGPSAAPLGIGPIAICPPGTHLGPYGHRCWPD